MFDSKNVVEDSKIRLSIRHNAPRRIPPFVHNPDHFSSYSNNPADANLQTGLKGLICHNNSCYHRFVFAFHTKKFIFSKSEKTER